MEAFMTVTIPASEFRKGVERREDIALGYDKLQVKFDPNVMRQCATNLREVADALDAQANKTVEL